MPTGTTTFSITRDQLINSVLRLQGWLDYTATADATKIANMSEALNIMLKQKATTGLKIWCIEELVLKAPTLVAGDPSYTIGPSGADLIANRPLEVTQDTFIRNVVNGVNLDTPLQRLAKNEYMTQGNKGSVGTPNSFMYDPLLPNGVFYLYTAPDTFTVASMEIHIFSRRQINDMTSGTDTFDVPQECYNALRFGLADETAIENKTPMERAEVIERKAKESWEALDGWDVEHGSVYFSPDMRGSR